jgi:hypothetical protein
MYGMPARPAREHMRSLAGLGKLPDALKDVQRIKEHLGLRDD